MGLWWLLLLPIISFELNDFWIQELLKNELFFKSFIFDYLITNRKSWWILGREHHQPDGDINLCPAIVLKE